MKPRALPAMDVSKLPSIAFGARDPLWWGVFCLMLIEGTMFVLQYAAYLVIRGNLAQFPPVPVGWGSFSAAIAGQVMLLASLVPITLSMEAAKAASVPRMKKWLIVAALPSFLFLACRGLELYWLPFRWDDNAHASIFWLNQAMQTFLALLGAAEDLVLIALLYAKPIEKKHLVDVHTNGVYWYFMVAVGVVTFAFLYLDPAILGTLPS